MSEKFTGQESGHEVQASHEQHEAHKPVHEKKHAAPKQPEKDPNQGSWSPELSFNKGRNPT